MTATMFRQQLAIGAIGEGEIARWLRRRGNSVLPAYEKVVDDKKGPRFYAPRGEFVAPDMLVFRDGKQLWIEAKTKTRFSWYAKGRYFVTGIDHRHYLDYLKVQETSGPRVWLLFLHRNSDTWENDVLKWGAPAVCPVGLFSCQITETPSHTANDIIGVPMIYWPIHRLRQIATIEEFSRG